MHPRACSIFEIRAASHGTRDIFKVRRVLDGCMEGRCSIGIGSMENITPNEELRSIKYDPRSDIYSVPLSNFTAAIFTDEIGNVPCCN